MKIQTFTRNGIFCFVFFLLILVGFPLIASAETDVTNKVELTQGRLYLRWSGIVRQPEW
jgi:hypothetical protein